MQHQEHKSHYSQLSNELHRTNLQMLKQFMALNKISKWIRITIWFGW